MPKQLNPELCSICGHDRKTARCPHPWKTPFERWPDYLLQQLEKLLQPEPSPGS